MPHQVRQFDLARVRRIWGRTLELHLGLYKGYVEQLNKLTTKATRGTDAERSPADSHSSTTALRCMSCSSMPCRGRRRPCSARERWQPSSSAASAATGSGAPMSASSHRCAASAGSRWSGARPPAGCTTSGSTCTRYAVPAMTDILLLFDLWEHAWLLDYAPKDRGRFVSDVIEQLNWAVIEARLGDGD